MEQNDLHTQLDQLAWRVEATIRSGREFIDGLPEFEKGASERAKKLDRFFEDLN